MAFWPVGPQRPLSLHNGAPHDHYLYNIDGYEHRKFILLLAEVLCKEEIYVCSIRFKVKFTNYTYRQYF